MTHAAARIFHVTRASRNDMQVQVRDGLPGRRAAIDAEIEAVGSEPVLDELAHRRNGTEQSRALFLSRVEPGGNVPMRHDEDMPLRDRKPVQQREDGGEAQDHPRGVRVAEGAGSVQLGQSGQGACWVVSRAP